MLFEQREGKQTRLTLIVGAAHDIYAKSATYIGMANTAMIASVFYSTTLSVQPWLSWLSFPLFVLLGLLLVLILGVVIWKVTIPILVAYNNYQEYKHSNLIRGDVSTLKNEIIELKAAVDTLAEKIKAE